MSYLATFLARHGTAQPAPACTGTEVPKVPEAPFVTFGTSIRVRVEPESAPVLDGLAIREVLGFRADWLPGLPLPTTLALEVPGVDGPITVATHARSGRATFTAPEWLAIVAAAEHGRAWPADFAAWWERKRREPRWRLTAAEALGPVSAEPAAGWSVGRVLQRLGVELRAVVIEGGGHRDAFASGNGCRYFQVRTR